MMIMIMMTMMIMIIIMMRLRRWSTQARVKVVRAKMVAVTLLAGF